MNNFKFKWLCLDNLKTNQRTYNIIICRIQDLGADFLRKEVSLKILNSWSQPQNPEFRINPENFHPCIYKQNAKKVWIVVSWFEPTLFSKQDISVLSIAMDNGLLFIFRCCWPEFFQWKWFKNSKWVWSGNTTITNCRQPRGTARKSRSTITRHQEDKLSKAISSLFPIKMIAILEWT